MSLEHFTAGKSLIVSGVTGIPSIVYASIVQPDEHGFLAVVSGIAVGVFALGWSLYRRGRDQVLETISTRLEKSEGEIDRYIVTSTNLKVENAELRAELAALRRDKHVQD